MKEYCVTMIFRKGPALTLTNILCFDEADARRTGREEAVRGGFGPPKQILVTQN